MNGKAGSTIPSSHSQRFGELLQRFFSSSQAGFRSDIENSFHSDAEVVEQITSYIHLDRKELEGKIENESVSEAPLLEPIAEESETIFEKIEEEDLLNAEEEDDRIESQSSHGSGRHFGFIATTFVLIT